MKKLPDDEKLQRGVQILLTARDKADLAKMASQEGVSLSAAARPYVLRALKSWRAKYRGEATNAETPDEAPAKTLVVNGKVVRSERSAELARSKANKTAPAAEEKRPRNKPNSTQRAAEADKPARRSRIKNEP